MTSPADPRSPQRLIAGVVAAAFLFGPAVAALVGVRPEAIENRRLAAAPSWHEGWGALDKVSPWATDHLPGRKQAVHAGSWIDVHVLGELPGSRQNKPAAVGPGQIAPPPKREAPGNNVPVVVRGGNGYLFFGQDFSSACRFGGGTAFERSLDAIAALADVIERSGRRVLFSVGPNKSAVLTSELPGSLPLGACAKKGIEHENDVLDHYSDPRFVLTRPALKAAHDSGQQVYWRTDTHWDSLGGAIVAQQLAAKLDPALRSRVSVVPATLRKVGDLNLMLGLTDSETPQSALVSTGARVVEDPALARWDPLKPVYKTEAWTARPAAGLVSGHSLLLGDSFTYYILGGLRPLFADGRFVWTGQVPIAEVVASIKAADTVVISMVQRSVVGSVYGTPKLRAQVQAALSGR